MATQVLIPQLGNEISEAEITEWIAKDGAQVSEGDMILSITTTKMAIDVDAPASGVLKIVVQEGDLVSVGTVVGEIS